MPFCRPFLEADMEILRPLHLLGMAIEPALPLLLDDLKIVELDS
jgi:hypothetical protein